VLSRAANITTVLPPSPPVDSSRVAAGAVPPDGEAESGEGTLVIYFPNDGVRSSLARRWKVGLTQKFQDIYSFLHLNMVPQSSFGGGIFGLIGPKQVLPRRVSDHRLEQFKRTVERFEFRVSFGDFQARIPAPMVKCALRRGIKIN